MVSTSGGRFEFLDHTGDIGVRRHGLTPGAVFSAGARAFTESVTDLAAVERRSVLTIDLESTALDLLLVDFLDELLYRFEVDEFLAADAEVSVEAGELCVLHAAVTGEKFDPKRHPSRVLIKAVTYHALELGHHAGEYHATVVFDV